MQKNAKKIVKVDDKLKKKVSLIKNLKNPFILCEVTSEGKPALWESG